jgi:hypothetical protein
MEAASRPSVSGQHPWRDVLDATFRPGSRQHRAADRLLTLRQSSREDLAAWSGLSGASISNLVNTLGRAGFDVHRWSTHRRVQFRILGYRRPPRRRGDVDERPVPAPDTPEKARRTDPRLMSLTERIGTPVRYLGDDRGMAVVEVSGCGTFTGQLLGPVLPVSLITGEATLQRITLDRGAIDLDIGDRAHRARLRLDLHRVPQESEGR